MKEILEIRIDVNEFMSDMSTGPGPGPEKKETCNSDRRVNESCEVDVIFYVSLNFKLYKVETTLNVYTLLVYTYKTHTKVFLGQSVKLLKTYYYAWIFYLLLVVFMVKFNYSFHFHQK